VHIGSGSDELWLGQSPFITIAEFTFANDAPEPRFNQVYRLCTAPSSISSLDRSLGDARTAEGARKAVLEPLKVLCSFVVTNCSAAEALDRLQMPAQ
jgi:hypothetical protein